MLVVFYYWSSGRAYSWIDLLVIIEGSQVAGALLPRFPHVPSLCHPVNFWALASQLGLHLWEAQGREWLWTLWYTVNIKFHLLNVIIGKMPLSYLEVPSPRYCNMNFIFFNTIDQTCTNSLVIHWYIKHLIIDKCSWISMLSWGPIYNSCVWGNLIIAKDKSGQICWQTKVRPNNMTQT